MILNKMSVLLRFLCSEPLSVQFSMWNKNEMLIPRSDEEWRCLCFNWINCNVGGAIDDGKEGGEMNHLLFISSYITNLVIL